MKKWKQSEEYNPVRERTKEFEGVKKRAKVKKKVQYEDKSPNEVDSPSVE